MIDSSCTVGGTLFEFIQSSTKLIEEPEILKFFTQLLLAISHIHSKQILHRDLKTQNILLDKTRKVIKVADFGISKVLTKTNAVSVRSSCFTHTRIVDMFINTLSLLVD